MLDRRQFVRGSTLCSLSPFVPAVLGRAAEVPTVHQQDRILVVIQLSGGNDGLNTVIPWSNENYEKYRPTLKVDASDVIKLNDRIGLHPAMKPAAELLDDGRFAIVQGVGYPQPNRSHFRSMAIWHSAKLDEGEHNGQGWIGRIADARLTENKSVSDTVYIGQNDPPSAVRGRRSNAMALNDLQDLMLKTSLENQLPNDPASLKAFIEHRLSDSQRAADRMTKLVQDQSADQASYPTTDLGRRLSLMAKMIRSEGPTRLFYVDQSGYDTHSAQRSAHQQLLRDFSTALKAFLDDMGECGFGDRVVVMAFSEFGRRVQENGSAGTDHGTAGPVFLAGEPVRSGLLGSEPSLEDLDDGDLKSTMDFRRIYAGLLQQWLDLNPDELLGERFAPLSVIA